MTKPSDRATAQAFWKACDTVNLDKKALVDLLHRIELDAREIDAAAPEGAQGAVIDAIAIALWHRFAPESHIEWKDETHKAEYRDAAVAVAALATPPQPQDAAPVAFVPVHPRNGPLWSDTYGAGSGAQRAESYPRMPLYGSPHWAQDAEDAVRDIKPDGFDAIQIAECQDLEQLRSWAGCMRRERDNWRRDAQSLAEQLAEDAEDAARYRWLRGEALWQDARDFAPGGHWWLSVTSTVWKPTFDAAIDGARAAGLDD